MVSMTQTTRESEEYPGLAAPHPGWVLRKYPLSRPVTREDIDAFLGKEDLYLRESGLGTIFIIEKYGLLEINAIIGNRILFVWINPEKSGFSSDYLDGLFATRF